MYSKGRGKSTCGDGEGHVYNEGRGTCTCIHPMQIVPHHTIHTHVDTPVCAHKETDAHLQALFVDGLWRRSGLWLNRLLLRDLVVRRIAPMEVHLGGGGEGRGGERRGGKGRGREGGRGGWEV